MKWIVVFLISFLTVNPALCQETNTKNIDFGISVQQYPTGFLFGTELELNFSPHHDLEWRLGANVLNHRDLGVHESEKGAGFGFSLGYRYFFKPDNTKWFIGLRNDIWWNTVNWKDFINSPLESSGQSKIVVFQPTINLGYKFLLRKNWLITPNLGFGAEFNVKTVGAEVGQGLIILWGIDIQKRIILKQK